MSVSKVINSNRRGGTAVAGWIPLPPRMIQALAPVPMGRLVCARWLLPALAGLSLVTALGTLVQIVLVGHAERRPRGQESVVPRTAGNARLEGFSSADGWRGSLPAGPSVSAAVQAGRVTVNVAPAPGAPVAATVPPWACTASRTNARPSPKRRRSPWPPRAKRSNIR
jgi:hypothetical protein